MSEATTNNWKEFEEKLTKAKEMMAKRKGADRGHVEEVLKERARKLTRTKNDEEGTKQGIFVLEFFIGEERYGIPAKNLKEIVSTDQITPIPTTPDFLEGVVNVRGKIISIINLKRFLQLDYPDVEEGRPIIIVTMGDLLVGMIVDRLIDMTKIDRANIQRKLPKLSRIKPEYIDGISDKTTIILNMDVILADEGMLVF